MVKKLLKCADSEKGETMTINIDRFIEDAYECWSKIKFEDCKALAKNGGFCRYWKICKYFDEAYERGYDKAFSEW